MLNRPNIRGGSAGIKFGTRCLKDLPPLLHYILWGFEYLQNRMEGKGRGCKVIFSHWLQWRVAFNGLLRLSYESIERDAELRAFEIIKRISPFNRRPGTKAPVEPILKYFELSDIAYLCKRGTESGLRIRKWKHPGLSLCDDLVLEIPALLTGINQSALPGSEEGKLVSSLYPFLEQHIADRVHARHLYNRVFGFNMLDLKILSQTAECSEIRIGRRESRMRGGDEDLRVSEKGHTTRLWKLDRIVRCRSMQFFVTDSWKLGITLEAAQEGDAICQFLGCDVALLMRRTEKTYRVLGRALVWSVTGAPISTRLEDVSSRLSTFPQPLGYEIWGGPMEVWCKMDLEALRGISSR
ncbi:hypothetical protein BKA65DRAFT_482145 [Rhexocercosporidium sp. MPI-PUGE-AT-0058]|nr:hypothetical protein BKA65DRAFT_482145 [Rhexocercosporidium sp. MPI-PUGE-AT-0058]